MELDRNMNDTGQKELYEKPEVLASYEKSDHLLKAEAKLLKSLKSRLGKMRMLDIGVGGGRTVLHFSPLVMEYRGIDYSDAMIRACRRRFPDWQKNALLDVCDVRNLGIFSENYFDFILFSFNGIDTLSHADRILALIEIRKVAKKGGIFYFSTHNLYATRRMLSIQASWRPVVLIKNIIKARKFRNANPEWKGWVNASYLICEDGAHGEHFSVYYVKPEEQIRQLNNAGFGRVRMFSAKTGKELNVSLLDSSEKNEWIYYYCEAV